MVVRHFPAEVVDSFPAPPDPFYQRMGLPAEYGGRRRLVHFGCGYGRHCCNLEDEKWALCSKMILVGSTLFRFFVLSKLKKERATEPENECVYEEN